MIKLLSVRARFAPIPLTPDKLREWDVDATNCGNLLNDALIQGYKIIERWPSANGFVLNVILHKEEAAL